MAGLEIEASCGAGVTNCSRKAPLATRAGQRRALSALGNHAPGKGRSRAVGGACAFQDHQWDAEPEGRARDAARGLGGWGRGAGESGALSSSVVGLAAIWALGSGTSVRSRPSAGRAVAVFLLALWLGSRSCLRAPGNNYAPALCSFPVRSTRLGPGIRGKKWRPQPRLPAGPCPADTLPVPGGGRLGES
jgi:hypothetical protein